MTEQAPTIICSAQAPWLLEFVGTREQAYECAWAAAAADLAARVVRGWKMLELDSFYDEIAAALQFPAYFGENRAALDDCLTDLSWLPASAYVLVVADANSVLSNATDDTLAMVIDAFVHAATEWATPVELGEPWDRAATPFHVVFQVDAEQRDSFRRRVAGAGGELGTFDPGAHTA